MDQDKKNLNNLLFLLLALFGMVFLYDWLTYNKILIPTANKALSAVEPILSKLTAKILFIKGIYFVTLGAFCFLTPSIKLNKNETPSSKQVYQITALLLSAIIFLGFSENTFYDKYLYPAIFFSHIIITSKAIATLRSHFKEDDILKKMSNKKENEFSFHFKTSKGLLSVHNPQQGIWIEGGAGSGKSASLIEPIIHQAIQKGYAGIIYDFKGNPPTLGLTAYNSLLNSNTKTKFGLVNFSNLYQSIRCNPIAPKYLITKNHLFNTAELILKNLKKEWVQKTDFWYDNAFAGLVGCIHFLQRNHPEICTLPHVINMTLKDPQSLIQMLLSDEETKELILPLAYAEAKNAEGQIAGAMATLELPMMRLKSEQLFWVLSKDSFDLDITSKQNPKILSISNDPVIKDSLSPAIALIVSTCLNNMNQQGKQKGLFCIDELPTLYIKNLDQLPATARSNGVSTVLGLQDFSQLKRDYGEKEADTTVSNLGNQFTGMTNNTNTAKRISQMLGKSKKRNLSYSESQSNLSESESMQFEDVMQARDIMGQPIGQFTGKIAGGEPPFFSAQFQEFKGREIFKDYISEIPLFAFKGMKISTGEVEQDKKILDSLIKENFKQINRDIEEIIKPFIVEPEVKES